MPVRITPGSTPPDCDSCGAAGEMFTRRKGRMVSWCGVCDPHCAWCLAALPRDPFAAKRHIHGCSLAALRFFGFENEPRLAQVIDLEKRPFDLDTE